MAATFETLTQQFTDYFADVGIYRYKRKQKPEMLALVSNALALFDYHATSLLQSSWEAGSRRQSFTLNYSDTSVLFNTSDVCPTLPTQPKKPARPYGMISEKEVAELLEEAEKFLKRFGMSLYKADAPEASDYSLVEYNAENVSPTSSHVARSLFQPARAYGAISAREVVEVYEEGRKFIERYEALKAKKAQAAEGGDDLYPVSELSFDGAFLGALDAAVKENSLELSFPALEDEEPAFDSGIFYDPTNDSSLNLSGISTLDSSLPLPEVSSTPIITRHAAAPKKSDELIWLEHGEKNLNDYQSGQEFSKFWGALNVSQRFALTADRTMRNLAYKALDEHPSREEFAEFMMALREKFNVPAPVAPEVDESHTSVSLSC